MPRRAKSHETDEAAQRVFRAAIPRGWVVREQRPDYGVDYVVEIFEEGRSPSFTEPSGLQWGVQLKGTVAPKTAKGRLRFRVETDHLKYYVDRCRQPTFLVVINVRCATGYWVFLQGYVLDELKRKNWRAKDSVTILLPMTNRLSDTESLKTAIQAADKRMAELHPAAIEGAIRSERQRLESLDPRFRIEIQATEQGSHRILHAKEPVPFTIIFQGERNAIDAKIHDLFGRGVPAEVQPGEVQIHGSPLLERVLDRGGTLHVSREVDCTIDLVARNAACTEMARVAGIPAKLTGGTEEFRMAGCLSGSPLAVSLGGRATRSLLPSPVQLSVSFRPEAWIGQPIVRLAYFGQAASLFSALAEGAALGVECFHQGNRVFSAEGMAEGGRTVADVVHLINILRKARALANRFNVLPRFPSTLGKSEIEEIEELHSFCEQMDHAQPAKGIAIRTRLVPRSIEELVRSITRNEGGEGATLELEAEGREFSLLGKKVSVGPHRYSITHTRTVSRPERVQRAFEGSADGAVEVEWEGTDQSTIRVEMLVPDQGPEPET